MRLLYLVIATATLAAGTTGTMAQNGGTLAPSGTPQPTTTVSENQAAIDRAAAANKYVFAFFWKEQNAQTKKAWSVFKPAVAKMAESAESVSIDITNPAEKSLVDRYDVSRAPMPLVLAIAPCGAITKGFTKTFDEAQLRTAIVSRCTERCMKALQDRKLVFVCVVDPPGPQAQAAIPKGVEDFKADEKFGRATEVVLISAADKTEAALLADMQVDPNGPKPVTVFMAPPAALIGKFDGQATKEQLVAKLVAARSNPCAGGKCGPGGCGPKK